MRRLLLAFALTAITLSAQAPPVNFEPSLVHPIAISPSGARLFALNTDAGILRVYSLRDPLKPAPLLDIPVGLAPVSLRARSDDEVWVVDSLSDSISVVSIPMATVIRVIPVKDDPADVIFAGTPELAYVSVAGNDQIHVFDPATETFVTSIPVPGKEPRALAVSPQNDKVYALVFRSGNRTTLIPTQFAPPPPPPTNPLLPPAPPQSLIVSLDDPQWATHPIVQTDIDLVAIDTATRSITASVKTLGTINYDLAVDSQTGAVVVGRTDADNTVQFEPALKSVFAESGLSIWDPSGNLTFRYDLNPAASQATRQDALSEPVALVIDSVRRHIWVAAQGSDRVARVSEHGEVELRIDLDTIDGKSEAMTVKRGPRGLAFDEAQEILYVFNRLSHSISVVDTSEARVANEISLGHDPMPHAWRLGRGFLYDARNSGHGTVSCASCHVDGEHDLLAWDLGDPGGEMTPVPPQAPHPSFPPNAFPPFDFHPMKGPMVTQTLRGLSTNAPYHWRGDRARLQDFNGAFASLLGGEELPTPDIDLFADFLSHISHPGNPNQNLDRTLKPDALAGQAAFHNLPAVSFSGGFQLTCAECHAGADGAGPEIVLPLPQTFIGPVQPTNTPQLRGLYRRGEALIDGTPSKVGFGFAHDGGLPTMRTFLDIPAFSLMPVSEKNNLVAFLMAFDSGTAPIVGYRFLVDASTANTPALGSTVNLLQNRALAGDNDIVLEARLDGRRVSFVFNRQTQLYESDRSASQTWTVSQLNQLAAQGRLAGAVMAVPQGEGKRRAFGTTGRSLTSRPSNGTNPHPEFVLEFVESADKDESTLSWTLHGLPSFAVADLLVTSGTGRTTQTTAGRWINSGSAARPPQRMLKDGGLRFALVQDPPAVMTVQARVRGLPGGITFSNAVTIKRRP